MKKTQFDEVQAGTNGNISRRTSLRGTEGALGLPRLEVMEPRSALAASGVRRLGIEVRMFITLIVILGSISPRGDT